jgi:hypothetical protein
MERDVKNERPGSMLLRFILYSVIAYLVIRLVRNFISAAKGAKLHASAEARQTPRQEPRKKVASTMIRCASCGTFITENSAMPSGNRIYCSTACTKIGTQRT